MAEKLAAMALADGAVFLNFDFSIQKAVEIPDAFCLWCSFKLNLEEVCVNRQTSDDTFNGSKHFWCYDVVWDVVTVEVFSDDSVVFLCVGFNFQVASSVFTINSEFEVVVNLKHKSDGVGGFGDHDRSNVGYRICWCHSRGVSLRSYSGLFRFLFNRLFSVLNGHSTNIGG
ncbi:hypothetical protein CEXT_460981 [Caerostris extrusa]|uniref:Uncharacterized protein n=1 Tax=Caerostris extrusa TaxID=172846 RepID=A0AAV4MUE6_CAEEX|nr:hypothetical protein CEXT_460981 [Caerostris extrusa]